jgi:hypothetical protein
MKLFQANRTLILATAGFLMAAYQFSPIPVWACSTSSSSGFSYSANTGPSSVTVCAKSVVSTKTTAPAKPAAPKPPTVAPAKPSPKPVATATTKPAPATPAKPALLTPIQKGVPTSLLKPTPQPTPKPVAKPTAKPTPAKPSSAPNASSSSSIKSSSAEVSFSPEPLAIWVAKDVASVGEEVAFWAPNSIHYKSGSLLGKPTDVRFTPVNTHWDFGDGDSGAGEVIAHGFSAVGSFDVVASVRYSVEYQIFGASGWVSSGEIVVSDSLSMPVQTLDLPVAPPRAPQAKVFRLVGENCLGKRSVFGCNP